MMAFDFEALSMTDVCDRCRQLDLRRFFESERHVQSHFYDFYVPIKGSEMWFQESKNADCPMCSILSQCIYDKHCKKISFPTSHETYGLVGVDAERTSIYSNYFSAGSSPLIFFLIESYPGLPPQTDTRFRFEPIECILGEGYALLQPRVKQYSSPVKAHSMRFNAPQVLTWMARCRDTHGSCWPPEKHDIEHYRLIDCHELVIVIAKRPAPYVALSYVWGSPREIATIHTNELPAPLPDNLPLAIKDAITVTKSLGFRYLWVDRLCIDQVNRGIRHRQLQEMDAIYANSELTIIGAAGQDGDYGLPGVSSRPRTAPLLAKLVEAEAAYIQHPYGLIRSSKWYSRGWTYQEAFLSRRRLVFLDNQTYFECMSDLSCEMLPLTPVKPWEATLKTEACNITGPGVWNGTKPEDLCTRLYYMTHVLPQYTARDLSYGSDSLNALAGILNHMKAQYRLFHILGIPWEYPKDIPQNINLFRDWKYHLRNDIFLAGLCWRHAESCWHGSRAPRRRLGFPSWTWAGWAGQIRYPFVPTLKYTNGFIKPDIRHIFLEGRRGPYSLLRTVKRFSLATLETPINPILVIKARALSPIFCRSFSESTENWDVDDTVSFLDLSEDIASDFKMVEILGNAEQWRCIYLGEVEDHRPGASLFFLILRKEQGLQTWSRVGTLQTREPSTDWEGKYFEGGDSAWEEYRIK